MKNLRTGLTASSAMTKQGGVATASVTLAALPGDQFSYTETVQVFCPVTGVWGGTDGQVGTFELAYTLTAATGGPRGTCTTVGTAVWCAYPQRDWCSGSTTPPDNSFNGRTINDTALWAYYTVEAICFSITGSQPWACSNGLAVGTNAPMSPGACTSHR